MAVVAELAKRLTVDQVITGSSPVDRLLLGCRLTGRTIVFEAIYRGSNPRIPVICT